MIWPSINAIRTKQVFMSYRPFHKSLLHIRHILDYNVFGGTNQGLEQNAELDEE
jgi:hypothetical protein